MIKSLRENPILLHQMSHARWPSLQTTWLLTATFTVIGLALPFIFYGMELLFVFFYLPAYVAQIELVLLFIGPLLAVVVAVVATVQAVNAEAYQTMQFSQLSEIEIASGYAASALFRLRSLWVVAGGIHLSMIMTTAIIAQSPMSTKLELTGIDRIVGLLFVMLCILVFIAWNYLAVSLGILMSFWHRRIDKALVRAIPLLVFIMVSVAVTVEDAISQNGWTWRLVVMIVMFAAITFGGGWWAMTDLTLKHVRSTPE